ncbi:Zinc finger, RING-H2-type [Dillenia turbinata]|uniref:Zinc finger, RING-H2-type n=1 Tax=Dillenia turbinata TaxID=194707 RepID=A0AAN8VPX2_9MAGN
MVICSDSFSANLVGSLLRRRTPIVGPNEEFQNGEVLWSLPRCHHKFHRSCIEKWLKMQRTCPLCRRIL